MSTTIIPDIYRHTARKSTVSRNVKPSSKNVSVCNSSFTFDNKSNEEQSIFDAIQYDIKLEKEISQQEQSFILIPDNEIEQMIVEETNEEIICDILEQIKNQIEDLNQTRTIISTDIRNVVDSIMNYLDENDTEESINTTNNQSISTTNDVQIEDGTRSLNEEASMESEQQSSMLSRSQIDNDIVEVGVPTSNTHSDICTCHCHQPASNPLIVNPTNEYLLFEHALKQTRQEQQHERSLNDNRLLQTLKRQHQELMNYYQRQLYINKIDREQQTVQINQHDSQIQTDLTPMSHQQQQILKPNVHLNGSHSTPKSKGQTAIALRPFNTFLTPIRTTGPSLQQLIPCLTTTTTATTTSLTNKVAIIKKPILIPITILNPSPVPTSSTALASSHEFVDLTEEDEEDGANKVSTQKITPTRPQQSPASAAAAIAVPTRIQPANHLGVPTTTIPLAQTFSCRPLPEQTSCDHTIARPQLSISQDNTIVRLTWNLAATPMESIQNYEIYAYKQNSTSTISDWKKIGTVKSMRLPMAVTLKEFQSNSHYTFAVRAISTNNTIGPFCEPKTIFTGNTPAHPPYTSQIFNIST